MLSNKIHYLKSQFTVEEGVAWYQLAVFKICQVLEIGY